MKNILAKKLMKKLDMEKVITDAKEQIELDELLFEKYLAQLNEIKEKGTIVDSEVYIIDFVIEGIEMWLKKMRLARNYNMNLNRQYKAFKADVEVLKKIKKHKKLDKIDKVIEDIEKWLNEVKKSLLAFKKS